AIVTRVNGPRVCLVVCPHQALVCVPDGEARRRCRRISAAGAQDERRRARDEKPSKGKDGFLGSSAGHFMFLVKRLNAENGCCDASARRDDVAGVIVVGGTVSYRWRGDHADLQEVLRDLERPYSAIR